MSQENLEQLRALYEGAPSDIEDHLASDFELRQASSIIDSAGVFHGRTALRDVLAELREVFDDLTMTVERVVEAPAGDIVVLVRVQGRGRGSGIEVDNHIAHVWTPRGTQFARMVVYEDPQEALGAVGLQE